MNCWPQFCVHGTVLVVGVAYVAWCGAPAPAAISVWAYCQLTQHNSRDAKGACASSNPSAVSRMVIMLAYPFMHNQANVMLCTITATCVATPSTACLTRMMYE